MNQPFIALQQHLAQLAGTLAAPRGYRAELYTTRWNGSWIIDLERDSRHGVYFRFVLTRIDASTRFRFTYSDHRCDCTACQDTARYRSKRHHQLRLDLADPDCIPQMTAALEQFLQELI